MGDLNDEAVLTGEIPLPDVDHDALVTIAKSLAKLRAMKESGQSYTYKPLRELIEKNLPALDEKSLHEFLKAALFLDLSMLYKPAVALWVDFLIGKKPVTTEQITQAEALLEKNLERLKKNRLLAPDLEPLFHIYFGHFKKLVPNEQKNIELPKFTTILELIQVGAKLYFTKFASTNVTPADPATFEFGKPIAVGHEATDLVAAGNKIYVGNAGENTISIIDATTETVVGQMQAGSKPMGRKFFGVGKLAIVGNKLYAWNQNDKTLFVIDLRSEKVVAELPFEDVRDFLGGVPDMKAVGDILYVLTSKNIFMVDTKTDKVSAPLLSPWKDSSGILVISSNKAYRLDEKGDIIIYDLKTKKEVGGASGCSIMASLGTLVFVGCGEQKTISIWDSASERGNEIVGSIDIPFSAKEIFVVGDTIYVGDRGYKFRQIKIDSYYLDN